jgi:hypothetical protein
VRIGRRNPGGPRDTLGSVSGPIRVSPSPSPPVGSRRLRRRIGALALALAASACGGDGRSGYVPDDEIVVSATLPVHSPYGAYTTWGDGPTRIEVRKGLSLGLTDLLIHELEHAAGIDGHLGPECYRSKWTAVGLGDPPCEQELDEMRAIDRTFYVHVDGYDHDLEDATRWACDFWNEWTGREMFAYGG